MGGNIVVDDGSPNVAYSGNWQVVQGSTRQWDGAVHTTFQRGASAVIRFRATTVTVLGTIPAGNGEQALVDIKLDDMPTVRVTRTSGSGDVYDDTFWTSPTLRDITHTLTLTNQGGGNDLNFSFDRLNLDGNSFDPVLFAPQAAPQPPAPPPPPTTTIPNTTTAAPQNPQPGQQTDVDTPALGVPKTTAGNDNGATSQPPTTRDPSLTSTSISSQASGSKMTISGTVTPDLQPTVTQTQTQLHRFTLSDGSPDPNNTSVVNINAGGGGSQGSSPPLAGILGGILGGLLVIGLIVLACLLRKRQRKAAHARLADTAEGMQEGSTLHGIGRNRSPTTPRPFVDAEAAVDAPSHVGLPLNASAEKAAMREQMDAMFRGSPITPSSVGSTRSRATRGLTELSSPTSSDDKRHDTCFCHPHGPNSPILHSAHTRATLQLHDKPSPFTEEADGISAKWEGPGTDPAHSPSCTHSPPGSTQEDTLADLPRTNLLDMPPSYMPITRRYSTAV